MAADICGDPTTGHAPDLCRDLLNDDHQREGEDERPGEAIAKLRADLAVRANARRIVVRRPGDEAGAEAGEEAFAVLLGHDPPDATAKPAMPANCSGGGSSCLPA